MALVTKSIVVELPQLGRVDRIVQLLADCSRSQLRGLFEHRCVTINAQVCQDLGHLTEIGDQVTLRYDPEQRYREKKAWHDPAFSIVFEDRNLIVVDKAAHVLSVPTERGESNTLVDRVSDYLRSNSRVREAYIVHRLDRGVSGLIVFAKTREMAARLHAQFRDHKPERKYLALVAGQMTAAEGTFRSHLATRNNLDRFSTTHPSQGELAITHFRVLRQFPDFAAVEVRLETGRRNQIRVHFAEAGHPVLGDARYDPSPAKQTTWAAPRLALHAACLAFHHPKSGERLCFESAPPPEMAKYFASAAPRTD